MFTPTRPGAAWARLPFPFRLFPDACRISPAAVRVQSQKNASVVEAL
jgi:hypothetical protein